MEAQMQQAALQRRKNGFEPSCEACRKAKAKCDHQSPCSRCVRQGKTCFFHPAPMSQIRKRSPDGRPQAVSALREPSRAGSSFKRSASSPLREEGRVAPSIRQAATALHPWTLQTGAVLTYSRRPASFRVGYMGSTGFGAILQEHKSASLWENPDVQPSDNHQPNFWGRGFGASILAWLPTQTLFEQVIDHMAGLSTSHMFSDCSTTYHFTHEFWAAFGSALHDSPDSAAYADICETITRNTRHPLPVPSSNSEWLASFCGKKTRWEGIGEIFIGMGACAFSVPDHYPLCRELMPEGSSKKSFALTMLECADACAMLSDEISAQSSLSQVILLNDIVGLQAMLGGDTSSELWKRVGSLTAAATGLGLHLRPTEAESQSALYRETRSTVFLSVFATDKALATFLGRPPCLGGRFVSAIMPLDVPTQEFFEESSIAELAKRVDENGWNRTGKIYAATGRRARYIMEVLRDEILELSLSPFPRDFNARINDLRYRLDGTMNQLPVVFHKKFDKSLLAEKTIFEVVLIAQVQLLHLQNVFLLERIDHPNKDEQRLLHTARNMLSMVVLLWSERDRYPSYRDVVHWFICCYGIPAASSLAIDLWLQTMTPHANPASNHRASVIQNLSVFVACLEWVGPNEGNYILCARVAKMIQNILERALAPHPDPPMPAPSAAGFDLTDISLDDMPSFGQDWENWFDLNSGWTGAMQY